MIDAFEDQLSIYRPDSELNRVNQRAAECSCPVDPQLFDLLLLARDVYEQTAGAFDITCGPLWEVWGFRRRQGRIPSNDEIAEARLRTGMQDVDLNLEKREVRFRESTPAVEFWRYRQGFCSGPRFAIS